MSLSSGAVRATIAVSDIAAARRFYEDTLGLTADEGGPDGVRIYRCGGGTILQVYESPDHAGKSTATLASFGVEDVEATVAELSEKGVTFERSDAPSSDERGIHTFGSHRVGWFKDPEGNVIAIDQ